MRSRRYVEIPADAIPARTRQAAASAAAFAATDLGIPTPGIRWFADSPTTAAEAFAGLVNGQTPPPPAGSFEHEQGIVGKTAAADDGVIWVKAWQGARRTAEVAMHETLHVWQWRLVGPSQGPHEWAGREEQARAYVSDSREIARTIELTTPYEGESNA